MSWSEVVKAQREYNQLRRLTPTMDMDYLFRKIFSHRYKGMIIEWDKGTGRWRISPSEWDRLEIESRVYYPFNYLYWGFVEEPPQKPKSKIRNRLEWFAIAMGLLVCGWILYVQKGVMRE